MKIDVVPEGRAGIYIPERESLKTFICERSGEKIHCFMPTAVAMLGADHETGSVIAAIDRANRLAVLTGPALKHNMNHALALVMPTNETEERLEIYDIGEITADDLNIAP